MVPHFAGSIGASDETHKQQPATLFTVLAEELLVTAQKCQGDSEELVTLTGSHTIGIMVA